MMRKVLASAVRTWLTASKKKKADLVDVLMSMTTLAATTRRNPMMLSARMMLRMM